MDVPANDVPIWILTIVYWLHMMATVVWIGGLVAMALLIFPAIRTTLKPEEKQKFLSAIQKRFQPISWLSLMVLIGTGMVQMSAHPAYDGFLALGNQWSLAIFIKHGLIIFLVVFLAILTWGILPALKRIALRQMMNKPVEIEKQRYYQKMESYLVWGNMVVSILVLIFTAWARSVS